MGRLLNAVPEDKAIRALTDALESGDWRTNAGSDIERNSTEFQNTQNGIPRDCAQSRLEAADDTAILQVQTDPLVPENGTEAIPATEAALNAIFRGVAWDGDPDRRILAFAPSDMPEGVRERLVEVLRNRGLFQDFDTVDDSQRWKIVDEFAESLETGDAWTVRDLAESIQARTGLTDYEAFRISRTEMAAVTNKAREDYYEQEGVLDSAEFRWTGPQDARTTEACEWLKEQTRDGVSYDKLIELEREASETYFPKLDWRKHVIHPFERHTYVRQYDR